MLMEVSLFGIHLLHILLCHLDLSTRIFNILIILVTVLLLSVLIFLLVLLLLHLHVLGAGFQQATLNV